MAYPPEFKTNRLTIKPYKPTDEDRFVEMALDEISVQFMGGSSGIEAEERKLFKKILDIYTQNNERWFWIWGIYTNNLLSGHLEIKETDDTNTNELEVVYMIHPEERRKGIMAEVLSILKEQQKNWQKTIIATISPENKHSLALLKKWGITKREVLVNSETKEEYLKLTLSTLEIGGMA